MSILLSKLIGSDLVAHLQNMFFLQVHIYSGFDWLYILFQIQQKSEMTLSVSIIIIYFFFTFETPSFHHAVILITD